MMSPEYKAGLLGLAFSVFAVPFLVRAWRSRQLRVNDDTMYTVVKGEENPSAVPVATVSPARARLAGIALAAALLLVAAMVVLTVVKSRAPAAAPAPPVQSGPPLPS